MISNSSLLLELNPNIYRLQTQHFPEINQTVYSETTFRLDSGLSVRRQINCGDEGQLVFTLQTQTRSYTHQVDVEIEIKFN